MPSTTDSLPDVRIRVNGTPLRGGPADDLIAVTVQEDLGALAMFTIELHNWNQHSLKITWSDRDLFLPGARVELSLGYVDAVTRVMSGEVTSLEPMFVADEPHRLVVRGFDHGLTLQRGSSTRSFAKMKDSAIAVRLASDAGLRHQVADSRIVNDQVLQNNQSDWAFLAERARRLGYVLFVRDDRLHFEPPGLRAGPVATLSLSEDVESFHPRLSGWRLADTVVVRGWSTTEKKEVQARAAAGQAPVVGPGRSGLVQAKNTFGSAESAVVTIPVRQSSEADAMARAELSRTALAYVTGEVVCRGRPEIHAGDMVRIDGAGKRFSGPYHVSGVRHTFDSRGGFRTRLNVQRSAA